ncbi:killer cell immunoglobulin-like receptor 2DL5A [Erinaceus europaeus]|uniref:Killer cell immunoglobulin-like receptor 2DL5A n=1 Tax=Erinaceus europaeus TaxID=9365 RepID=A0A1S3AHQ3_ERIEU|nr:killer cell immunoglobulin-like receptor 2DL5A [Erinaceus europaeus]
MHFRPDPGDGLKPQLSSEHFPGSQVLPSAREARPRSVPALGTACVPECHSPLGFNWIRLYKDNDNHIPELQEEYSIKKSSLLGPVTLAHAGTYRCQVSSSGYEWSAHSDPQAIVVTGMHRKPSLSALQGLVVASGDNVTLACSSDSPFDDFHLSREGEASAARLPAGHRLNGTFQALFPLGPVSPAHGRAYRCHGSLRKTPYTWSEPSDPLLLSVTGLHRKLSLSALQGPVVVTSGQCDSGSQL